MTKGRIISALILIGALAISGSLYKFYFAAKLQEYEDDAALKSALEAKATEVENAFYQADPQQIMAAWQEVLPRFEATRDRRGSFFNFADWEEHPVYEPSDGIVKYWYEEEATAMMDELRAKIMETRVPSPPLMNLRAQLRIPTIANYQGRNVAVEVAHEELKRLSFAIHAAELLLDNNVQSVQQFWLWKPREANNLGGLLTYQTIGCQIFITLPDLISFFEDLRASDRYYTVDAIRLQHNSPGANQEPVINAQFILTMARYNRINASVAVGGVAAAAGPAAGSQYGYGGGYQGRYGPMGGPMGGRTQTVEPPGFFDKAWAWFKRYILYTN